MRKGPLCHFLANMTFLNDEMPTSLNSMALKTESKNLLALQSYGNSRAGR